VSLSHNDDDEHSSAPIKLKKVLNLDDAVTPTFNPNHTLRPPNVNYLVIQESILQNLPTVSSGNKRFWNQCLGMEEVSDIVSDSFWWVLDNVLKTREKGRDRDREREEEKGVDNEENENEKNEEKDMDKEEEKEEEKEVEDEENEEKAEKEEEKEIVNSRNSRMKAQFQNSNTSTSEDHDDQSHSSTLSNFYSDQYSSPYFIRMSRNFVKLFEKIAFNKKDYFFGHFPDIMAFSLLLSFSAAYPKSKNRIDEQGFKQKLLDLNSEWICGFKSSSLARDHWVTDYDLAEGSKSAAERIKQMDSLGGSILSAGQNKNNTHALSSAAKPHSRPIRLSYNLQHSPFMKTYLNQIGKNDTSHLNVRVGLSFSPQRPVITFDHKKHCQKSKMISDRQHSKNPMATTLGVTQKVEQSRLNLMKNYKANKRDCHRNISEMRGWEAKAIAELATTERMLLGSDRTEFANVVTCNNLDAASGTK